jgi:molybdopterin adenylyltransferase
MIKVAIVTVSDRASNGAYEDKTGPLLVDAFSSDPFAFAGHAVVPDDFDAITGSMTRLASSSDLIITTGGTGLSSRDTTPEATRSMVSYEVPGIAEGLREIGRKSTPLADLSRQSAGVYGKTLIVNLPGSRSAVDQSIEYLKTLVPHAVAVLNDDEDHA